MSAFIQYTTFDCAIWTVHFSRSHFDNASCLISQHKKASFFANEIKHEINFMNNQQTFFFLLERKCLTNWSGLDRGLDRGQTVQTQLFGLATRAGEKQNMPFSRVFATWGERALHQELLKLPRCRIHGFVSISKHSSLFLQFALVLIKECFFAFAIWNKQSKKRGKNKSYYTSILNSNKMICNEFESNKKMTFWLWTFMTWLVLKSTVFVEFLVRGWSSG